MRTPVLAFAWSARVVRFASRCGGIQAAPKQHPSSSSQAAPKQRSSSTQAAPKQRPSSTQTTPKQFPRST
eukprot:8286709-Lingulodinium_polyedra.AAC.1